jgi:hypothetical protein
MRFLYETCGNRVAINKQVFRQKLQVAENAVRHKDGLRSILENQPILAKQTVRRIRAWK